MRAKSIKNKAKINADLSPAELKAMLKKAKAEAITFQQYIKALEGEVFIWRSGGTVKKEDYASMEKVTGIKVAPMKAVLEEEEVVPDIPESVEARTEAVLALSRSSSPTPVLQPDEREDFLKRENELMDQIADKESELTASQKLIEGLREELAIWKEDGKTLKSENETMTAQLGELKVLLDKVMFDSKEAAITLESLADANKELTREIEILRKELATLRQSQKDSAEAGKAQKKSEMMAKMMAELSAGTINEKEQAMRETLQSLDRMEGDGVLSNAEATALRQELNELRTLTEQQEQSITDLSRENEVLGRKRDELEARLTTLELEYEELLDKTIQEEEAGGNMDIAIIIQEIKQKLESQYAHRRDQQASELDELKDVIAQKSEDMHKLTGQLAEVKRQNEELSQNLKRAEQLASGRMGANGTEILRKEEELEKIKKAMAQQLSSFDVMKKALMRDLQNRCEKVVALEISLDEMKEQYNVLLRNSDSKLQQKKMAFLERNLEQLTQVQRQLVEQNAQLKKDFMTAEKKLLMRNERIQSLELLLQDAQMKLVSQNQKFEAQLQVVRERLEQARSVKPAPQQTAFSFGRIAKPLRGGGASATQGSEMNGNGTNSAAPTVQHHQQQPSNASKRTSWLAGWRTG